VKVVRPPDVVKAGYTPNMGRAPSTPGAARAAGTEGDLRRGMFHQHAAAAPTTIDASTGKPVDPPSELSPYEVGCCFRVLKKKFKKKP
jgi:hypothetical protein